MSEFYSKVKRWVSGVLAIQLILGVFVPAVAYGATPLVSVDFLATSDTTPALSGTVNDPTAVITVTVNSVPYSAINNGATWNIPDNIIGPLLDGVYDVSVLADNSIDPPGIDSTLNELVIDTIAPVITELSPIPDPTNDNTPAYSFVSNESGTIVYGGDCTSSTTVATVGVNTVVFDTLADGLYPNCTIDVFDSVANKSNQLLVSLFNVDTVSPIVLGVNHGSYYNSDVTPTFNEGTAVLKYSGNEVSFNSGDTVSDENVYVLDVIDAASNKTTVVFTIDKTAPVITLNGNNPYVIERGTSFTDPGAVSDSGEGVVSNGTVNTSVIGDYTITYDATDLAGNAAIQITRDVLVRDTLYPYVNAGTDKVTKVPIYQEASANDGPFALVSYVWSQDDGPGTVTFGDRSVLEEDAILSADVDGVYDLRLTVTDAGGNESYDLMQLVWDTTAPVVDTGNDVVTNSPFTQDATTSDATSGIAGYVWTQEDGPGTVSFNTSNAEDTLISADVDGIYVVRLTVTDNAGNIGWDEFTLVWDTVNPTVDQTNVEIDYDPYVDGIGFVASADVSDDRSGIDTASCEYTLDRTNWSNASYDFINDRCYVNLSFIVDGTLLTINFRVWDNAGNIGIGSSVTRIVDSLSPNFSNPTVTPDFAGYTSANPSISVDVTDTVSPVTSCEYRTQENSGGWSAYIPANWNGSECSFNLSNLNDGSSYDVSVRAYDSVGHAGTIGFSRIVDASSPVVDAGNDIRTNVQSLLDATAADAGSGILAYSWTQVSGPGLLTFVSPDTEDTLVSANKDGIYIARLNVTDNVGNSSSDMVKIEWDTKVNVVVILSAKGLNKEAKVNWKNPTDKDLKEISLYRSEKFGDLGEKIATVYPNTESFVDTGLSNGKTYYYTVETIDDLGNSAKSGQVFATPEEPKTVDEVQNYNYLSDDENEVKKDDSEDQGIKSGTTDNTDNEEEKIEEEGSTEIPTFGIIVLVLLIGLGMYLLYLQNPEMFKKIVFWKREKRNNSQFKKDKQE